MTSRRPALFQSFVAMLNFHASVDKPQNLNNVFRKRFAV